MRFTYRTDDGAFAVARVRCEDDTIQTAVGPIGHLNVGEHLVGRGNWVRHASFGHQFRVEQVMAQNPRTLVGLERYLGSGAVRGLGPEFARRVVEAFGLNSLQVIDEEPERLLEVRGIGERRLAQIREHWQLGRAQREVLALLRGYDVGAALANRIAEKYGAEAPMIIEREPYRLARDFRGVGFLTADRLARAQGIREDDPRRAEAALMHLLREADRQGHCFVPRAQLLERVQPLDVPTGPASTALVELVEAGTLVLRSPESSSAIYLPELDRLEDQVARRVAELATTPDEPSHGSHSLTGLSSSLGLVLGTEQRDAIEASLSHHITVVTGGPGTGKTTLIRVLVEAANQAGETLQLAAPTGRAAQRLTEATGQPARTLHRLLEFNAHSGRFSRNRDHLLDADGVLVDETSMVDLRLFASLLDALPERCRLVLVGDADQLPSVGSGRILGDLCDSGRVPVVRLTEIYRQAGGSGIVRNAHRINHGENPTSAELEEGATPNDFFVIPREDPAAARNTLLRVVAERLPALGFNPVRDVQVLTPMHGGVLGTDALNRALQASLNPSAVLHQTGERGFRRGDRVLQVRNDYDNDIFNGDVGLVADGDEDGLQVDFDGRLVNLSGAQLQHLELAYAMTIHKSQGSEYPAVVVALHRAHRIMLRRNLLYTAVTRSQRFCCVVGDPWAIGIAVRESGTRDRWTNLARRLDVHHRALAPEVPHR
jgi:exodeoxyribonuclease V alpha subunit